MKMLRGGRTAYLLKKIPPVYKVYGIATYDLISYMPSEMSKCLYGNFVGHATPIVASLSQLCDRDARKSI